MHHRVVHEAQQAGPPGKVLRTEPALVAIALLHRRMAQLEVVDHQVSVAHKTVQPAVCGTSRPATGEVVVGNLGVCYVIDPERTGTRWADGLAHPQYYHTNLHVCVGNFLCPVTDPLKCGRRCYPAYYNGKNCVLGTSPSLSELL